MLQVVWFKRDLRVADHAPLADAVASGMPVLPLYIVEPALWAEPDAAARHWQTIADALIDLRAALFRLGQPLVVRVGDAVSVLDEIHAAHRVTSLFSHEETGNGWTYARDRAVRRWCGAHSIPWIEHRQTGVIRRLPDRRGWARRWDAFMAKPIVPAPQALRPLSGIDAGCLPSGADLGLAPDLCPSRQHGGRQEGLDRLRRFLHSDGRLYRRAMSSPEPAALACSRLSVHLCYGTLSLREVAQAALARRRDTDDGLWRQALDSFIGRLHWHCHFMQKLEDDPSIEFRALHPAYRDLDRAADPDRLDAWISGRTGWPFVDACLRSLAATGWLNFRMRAMLMSVASYQLWLPWRTTGLRLARWFTDYEPGIHWPQAQMQSGTTGINTIRIYNPVKQGYDHDPLGRFVRRWVPELDTVPDGFIHEPWRWDGNAGLHGRYPVPVIDHEAAARLARERVWAIRRAAGFAQAADTIQQKHGSRRSGLPPTATRRRPKVPAGAPVQLSLTFDE